MVTAKNRFEYVQRSIRCYIDQKYPNKELIIINEGPTDYQAQIDTHVKNLNRPDIRCLWLNGVYTLGALRNISMSVADGEYFCQWDDDDYCLPFRLMSQYSYLSQNSCALACFFSDQLQYFFQTRELYWSDWKMYCNGGNLKYSLIPGTIFAKIDLGIKYPSDGQYCRAGEDSVLSDALIERDVNSVITLSGGTMHAYTHHGSNVYDIEHHKNIVNSRSHHYEFMIKNRSVITKALKYYAFSNDVRVMSREGLAFIYHAKTS